VKELPEILKKTINIDFLERLEGSMSNLGRKEKMVFWFLVCLLFLSSFIIFAKINRDLTVEVPRKGGEIVEGVVGSPRFINPVLAIGDADRDLTQLIYSGLMKATPEGTLVNDLAESYFVTDDGLSYTFVIKKDAEFHDGVSVTADDVVFTIDLAKNDSLKSPRRASWDGVGVEKVDERTIVFHLKTPYSPFLENMVMGILPKHIWRDLTIEQITFSERNSNPVGSGPFRIQNIKKNSDGIPESYTLKSFKKYTLGEPFIDKMEMKFFDNEEELVKAFDKRVINSVHAVSPESAEKLKKNHIITSPLPRVFGVFFNQNQARIFTQKEVRLALNEIDKEMIISEVLKGFGRAIDGPLPAGLRRESVVETSVTKKDYTKEAINILEKNGWSKGEDGVMIKKVKKETLRLSFSLSTSNAPELKAVANILKKEWEKIGAEVKLEFFETGNLNQEVIRPRKYDSLLFGEIIGRDFDLFAFWHSSQRNDPGLNIALYTNITSDNLLQNIRSTGSRKERENLYDKFEKEIEKDVPAVFLYSPEFIYVTNRNIKGINLGVVTTPSERFLNVNEWHLETDRVWTFLAN
jgi:peptide/nickel transport system substrate-binding protein